MDYDRWLEFQHTFPRRDVIWDMGYRAWIRLVPCQIAGLTIVHVEGHGFFILTHTVACKHFPLLFEPAHRYFDGARPITFIEGSYVYAPYVPTLTKK